MQHRYDDIEMTTFQFHKKLDREAFNLLLKCVGCWFKYICVRLMSKLLSV